MGSVPALVGFILLWWVPSPVFCTEQEELGSVTVTRILRRLRDGTKALTSMVWAHRVHRKGRKGCLLALRGELQAEPGLPHLVPHLLNPHPDVRRELSS